MAEVQRPIRQAMRGKRSELSLRETKKRQSCAPHRKRNMNSKHKRDMILIVLSSIAHRRQYDL